MGLVYATEIVSGWPLCVMEEPTNKKRISILLLSQDDTALGSDLASRESCSVLAAV
jgi:hypothetical protein